MATDYGTPDWFFQGCNEAWGPFALDAAASLRNRKIRWGEDKWLGWLGPDHRLPIYRNALSLDWAKEWINITWKASFPRIVWLNPPYVNLKAWVDKCIEQQSRGLKIVALLPWGRWAQWCELAKTHAELIDVVGRIPFLIDGKPCASPPAKNIVAIFRPPVEGVKWPVGFTGAEISGRPPA